MHQAMQELHRIHRGLRRQEICRRFFLALLWAGGLMLLPGVFALIAGLSWGWVPVTAAVAFGLALALYGRNPLPTLPQAGAYADRQAGLPGTGLTLAHFGLGHRCDSLEAGQIAPVGLQECFIAQTQNAVTALSTVRPALWPKNIRLLLLPLGGLLLELLTAWGGQRYQAPMRGLDIDLLIVRERDGAGTETGMVSDETAGESNRKSRNLSDEQERLLRQRLEELTRENPEAGRADSAGAGDAGGTKPETAAQLSTRYAGKTSAMLYENRSSDGLLPTDIPAEYAALVRDYQNALAQEAEKKRP